MDSDLALFCILVYVHFCTWSVWCFLPPMYYMSIEVVMSTLGHRRDRFSKTGSRRLLVIYYFPKLIILEAINWFGNNCMFATFLFLVFLTVSYPPRHCKYVALSVELMSFFWTFLAWYYIQIFHYHNWEYWRFIVYLWKMFILKMKLLILLCMWLIEMFVIWVEREREKNCEVTNKTLAGHAWTITWSFILFFAPWVMISSILAIDAVLARVLQVLLNKWRLSLCNYIWLSWEFLNQNFPTN